MKMNNTSINLAAQSTYFKLKKSTSKDSGIFLDNTVYDMLVPYFSGKDDKGHVTINLLIYKEDCIKALANIMCSLPLFSSVAGVPREENNAVEIYLALSKQITDFFGENDSAVLSSLYITDLQGRKYLWGTEGKRRPFELRKFFVANHTELFFNTKKGSPVILRFKTHIVSKHKEEFEPFKDANVPSMIDDARQIIYYGAPGTGKSYRIKGLVRDGNHVRTTFHPDSDYASFVGAYKPTMIEISSRDMAGHVILDKGNEVKEKKIVYEFVAQAFLQAYTEAWKRSVGQMTDKEGKNVEMPEGMDDKYYLVIEEINRGNCAQIFGDLFQLLDRDDNGESSYAIRPDQDMKRYLAEQFKDIEALPETIRRGEEMKLPSNLYIFATMNTSDQSLFPIDSAFKRRWDWEYVPIKDEKKGYYIKVGDTAYLWSDFLEKINETILRVTQSDDKQMGYWFVHLPEGQKEISTDKFVGKVLFYLWNDVFKDFGDGEDTVFIGEKEDGSKYELRFKSFFGDERNERIHDLMRYNKIEPLVNDDDNIEQEELPSSEQGKKLKLRITLPNGDVIDENKVVDTYLKFFERFNPEDILNLNITSFNLPVISSNKQEGPNVSEKIQQKQLNNGWWIVCGNNATGYKRTLDKIIKGLDDGSVTEVYEA